MLKHFIFLKKVSFIKRITTFREKRKTRGGKISHSSCPNETTVLLPFFSPPTSLVYGFLKKKILWQFSGLISHHRRFLHHWSSWPLSQEGTVSFRLTERNGMRLQWAPRCFWIFSFSVSLFNHPCHKLFSPHSLNVGFFCKAQNPRLKNRNIFMALGTYCHTTFQKAEFIICKTCIILM